jgi:hypothetical protein
VPSFEIREVFVDGVQAWRLESDFLRVDVCPALGGRILSVFHKPLGHEFLWRNPNLPLALVKPGSAYDPNFWGGIDEVIPGDLPEEIHGLVNPDHGELWTLLLNSRLSDDGLDLHGILPVWGLRYRKRVALRDGSPWVDLSYEIVNQSKAPRAFLWKLHAAVAIEPGDRLVCPARSALVADPQWSRLRISSAFDWQNPPLTPLESPDRIPPPDGTTEFLFLYGLESGHMALRRDTPALEFRLEFDPLVFPYACYFASYGGLDGHYTAVLEPATAMPVSVNEAARLGQCSVLQPGERLVTRVGVYAGPSLI